MTELASLVIFANDLDATAAFYRAIGVPLVDEAHDDGPGHSAAELEGVHFAVYQAHGGMGAQAPDFRYAASTLPGFYVSSLDSTMEALAGLGAVLLETHQVRPWGCRALARDPDGRAIEVNQRGHCA